MRTLSRLISATVLVVPVMLSAQGGGGGAAGGAQPTPPKNLQVLPKEMSRPEVVARMRGIATSLGVRCEYCHVAVPGADGREQVQDYSLDDKDTKKTARSMMRMVNDINEKYLPDMGHTLTGLAQVSCETCHHGLAKPRTIQAEMLTAIDAAGGDSAVTLYRNLRVRYYGTGAYDFGELPLTFVQQYAPTPAHRPAAIALLRLNLEYFPKSIPTFQALVPQLLQIADTAAAVDVLNKAIAIQPDNPQLKAMLSRIKTPPHHE
jgi:photosynthetic reaction center cytochrome c subunit